jgi:hypothetical protein
MTRSTRFPTSLASLARSSIAPLAWRALAWAVVLLALEACGGAKARPTRPPPDSHERAPPAGPAPPAPSVSGALPDAGP